MAALKLKKIPALTRATNAYRFLTVTLVGVITDEPKRMHMRTWRQRRMEPGKRVPDCGTIGCIGGWTELLVNPGGHRSASSILGFQHDSHHTDELFFPEDLCNDDAQGTKRHGSSSMTTFEDKVHHAAGRLSQRYPTIARLTARADDFVVVGTYEFSDDWTYTRLTITNQPALDHWCRQ